MSKLLIDEPPLQVLPSLAEEIGLNEAIMLQQIHYWVKRSPNQEEDEMGDTRRWVYKTLDEWEKEMPFWSKSTIRRTLQNLEDEQVIIAEKKRKHKGDMTTWYAVNYSALDRRVQNEQMASVQNEQVDCSERTDGDSKVNSSAHAHNAPAPSETTTETTTETTKGGDKSPPPEEDPFDYEEDDWRYQAAKYLLDGLRKSQVLHSGIGDSKSDRQIADKWADTFRLLNEQDGYSKKVIGGTLWWLINEDDWWMGNAIQSGSNSALRSRKNGGAHKFDKLVQRARKYYESKQNQQADPNAIRDGFSSDRDPEPAGRSGDSLPDEQEVDIGGFSW